MFVVCVVCCQVEVSATGWSLVQRSPTDCGASLCVIKKPRERGGHSPRWAAGPEKIINNNLYMCCVSSDWVLQDHSVRNVVYMRNKLMLEHSRCCTGQITIEDIDISTPCDDFTQSVTVTVVTA
jgi:hypothetical protein